LQSGSSASIAACFSNNQAHIKDRKTEHVPRRAIKLTYGILPYTILAEVQNDFLLAMPDIAPFYLQEVTVA